MPPLSGSAATLPLLLRRGPGLCRCRSSTCCGQRAGVGVGCCGCCAPSGRHWDGNNGSARRSGAPSPDARAGGDPRPIRLAGGRPPPGAPFASAAGAAPRPWAPGLNAGEPCCWLSSLGDCPAESLGAAAPRRGEGRGPGRSVAGVAGSSRSGTVRKRGGRLLLLLLLSVGPVAPSSLSPPSSKDSSGPRPGASAACVEAAATASMCSSYSKQRRAASGTGRLIGPPRTGVGGRRLRQPISCA